MNYYTFQPDLAKGQPVLTNTLLGCPDDADPKLIQDLMIELLPGFPLSIRTRIRLRLILATETDGYYHYDLAFITDGETPEDVHKYQDAITANIQEYANNNGDLWEWETYFHNEHNLLLVSFDAG